MERKEKDMRELEKFLWKENGTSFLLWVSAIFYILCCVIRIGGVDNLALAILSDGYIYFKWIAVMTFVIWSAVRIVKKTIPMNNIWKRITTALLFASLHFLIFMIARSVLLYFQLAVYGGGWSHPSLVGNIMVSNMLYGGTGIPFSYGVLFLIVLAVSAGMGAVASAFRKKG